MSGGDPWILPALDCPMCGARMHRPADRVLSTQPVEYICRCSYKERYDIDGTLRLLESYQDERSPGESRFS